MFSGQGGLGAVAHLSGMGAGFLFLWAQAKGIKFQRALKAAPKKKSGHLRLIKSEDEEEGPRGGPKTWH